MRVLCLNYEYPPIGGGAGQVSRALNELLGENGYRIWVLTSGFRNMVGENEEHGCVVTRLRTLRRYQGHSNTAEKISYIVAALLYVHRLILRFKPDFVHAHFAIPSGIVAYYIKKRYSIPYMISSHGGDLPGFAPETRIWFALFNWIFRVVWRNADEVVVLNGELADVARKCYGVNARVIPNGVLIRDKAEKDSGVDSENVKLLFVGRLSKQKNVEFLIEALARVEDRNWKLFVVGDGFLRDRLEKMVREFRLEEKIIFTGWMDREKLQSYYRDCDVLCLPSVNEGISMAGLEAMANGMALLASDNGGNRELVENGRNGFVFRPGDQDDFSIKLKKMLSNPDKLRGMKRYSVEKAKNFSWGKIVREYLKIYERFSR